MVQQFPTQMAQQFPMRDKEIAQDLLLQEKLLAKRVNSATIESAHPQVRQVMAQIGQDIQAVSQRIFSYLNQRGWYNPRMADQQTMTWFQQAINECRTDVNQVEATRQFAQPGVGIGPAQTAIGGAFQEAYGTAPAYGTTPAYGSTPAFQVGERQYGPY